MTTTTTPTVSSPTASAGIPGTKTRTSLRLPEELVLAEWAQVGAQIGAIGRAALWWLGDWLNHGERLYGERHAQFVEDTGYAPHTLLNAARVARLVAPSRRREELDWSHHEVVSGLPPAAQDQLLQDAATGADGRRWTVAEIRAAARALLGKPPKDSAETRDLAVAAAAQPLLARLARDHQDVTLWPEYAALAAAVAGADSKHHQQHTTSSLQSL